MNESAAVFKPDDVVVTLEGTEYRLVYDLNSFCELEKIYDSIDSLLSHLLGAKKPTLENVTCRNESVNPEDIKIGDESLIDYVAKLTKTREIKYSDTLNLFWAGCLHDAAIFNGFNEITGYKISKAKLGSLITFSNMREINVKIVAAILRDLIPKNAEAPDGTQDSQDVQEIQQAPTRMVLHQ